MQAQARTGGRRVQSLGPLILERGAEVILRWYERWRRESPQELVISEAALRDLAPLQLEIVGRALADGTYRIESPRALWHDHRERLAPEERVLQRMPIEEIVHEYWLLVGTIRDWLEDQGIEVPFAEYSYFYEAMFELVAESVRRYSAFQTEQVSRERADYLAGLAHQMRGPLSVLTMALARLRIDADTRHERLLASMQRNLTRLTTQVAGVMRLERYKLEEVPVRPDLVYPGRLIDEIVFDVEDDAARKGLALEVSANRSASMRVDPDLLLDALANLIHNAIKYTDQGFVRVDLEETPEHVLFQVIDSGPGISPERRGTLFKPVQPATPGGVGIGLAVAYRCIKAQGGEIGVESEVGKGSTFWFTLPREVRRRD